MKKTIKRIAISILLLTLISEIICIVQYNIYNEELAYAENSQTIQQENIQNNLKEKIENLTKENEDLKKYVNDLETDNLVYQNSLKMAASVGVTPKNYREAPTITSRSLLDSKRYIGTFKGTAYTPSTEECGNNLGITYSGEPIIPGTSIAVDTEYWPIGTEFYIKGLGYVTAMDTGSSIKGKYRFDFAVFDKNFAYELGTRDWEVYLVKLGEG